MITRHIQEFLQVNQAPFPILGGGGLETRLEVYMTAFPHLQPWTFGHHLIVDGLQVYSKVLAVTDITVSCKCSPSSASS